MPYVVCERCELRTYSAALWASTEVCPRCGAELRSAGATVVSLLEHPRFVRAGKPLAERLPDAEPQHSDEERPRAPS